MAEQYVRSGAAWRRGRPVTRALWLAPAVTLLAGLVRAVETLPPPRSIEELRDAQSTPALSIERELKPGPGFRAYLATYRSAGLKVHALVAVPAGDRPGSGYPALIANHGFHPEPARYGITADGTDWRPGDYYRDVPAVFTRAGFLVLMPDYRGHNDSEGYAYTQSPLATRYYTEDVLALLAAVPELPEADPDQVFMWGHSMGGEVTLRVLLATDRVRGASLWAPVAATLREQARHRVRRGSGPDRRGRLERAVERPPERDAIGADEYLPKLPALATPLLIHHARGDASVPFVWSERLAGVLERHQKRHVLYPYDGDQHLFRGEQARLAVARDTAFFRSLMGPEPD